MLSHPSFSSPLVNEDLPAGPQLVFTLNNRFFRHQACYSLPPAKPGGQADLVVSLCKYKVVGKNTIVYQFKQCIHVLRAGHIVRIPLKRVLSVDLLINGSTLILKSTCPYLHARRTYTFTQAPLTSLQT
jgi:hypothetical protein